MAHQRVMDELTKFKNKVDAPAVIGAVTTADELIAIEAIGTRSRTDDQPVTVEDQWHLGSCTKSITALLYAALVEAGIAEWEVPLTDLFGDVHASSSAIASGWENVTIDDLLRCRGGVPANPTTKQMLAGHKSTASPTDQRCRAVERVLAEEPKNPGSFLYSNLGYALVGAAIDRLTGLPFEEAMVEHVFRPLGISSAGFGPPPVIAGHRPRVRIGPMLAGKGSPIGPDDDEPADNPVVLTPAGRIHITIADWAKILRVFLNDGEPLVSPELIEHLLSDPGADEKGRSMSMGWAGGGALGVTHAMQGSNTLWAATALLDTKRQRAGLTVANDGRMSVITGSAHLAAGLLRVTRT